MEALGINLGYLLVQILNFAIIFVVLRVWVYKPILGLLERRRERIAQGLEDARVAAEARANAEKEAQAILGRAQADANQKVRESAERAEQVAREIHAAAEKDAAAVRAAAAGEAEQARSAALGELRGQVAALAIAAAQKLIGESLDEKRQRHLVQEFFSGIKEGRVVVLEGESLQGASAEVTSALPLTEAEQDTVRKQLAKPLGAGAPLSFRVNPAILGGIVIRVGDKVIDGSVAGQLEGLRQSLR
ncbi:MAG: atpF atpH [Anaerolineales bacterium]|nr:atpF atpH [Anaerolineales bacterium]